MLAGTGYTENTSRRILQRGDRGGSGGKPPPQDGGSGSGMAGPGGMSNLSTASGFAITGGPIFNALSGE